MDEKEQPNVWIENNFLEWLHQIIVGAHCNGVRHQITYKFNSYSSEYAVIKFLKKERCLFAFSDKRIFS